MCVKRRFCLANTFFHHRMIHRYSWRRDERGDQKSVIDYVTVGMKLRKHVLDAKVMTGMFEETDHYAGLDKIKMLGRWKGGERKGNRNEVKQEYERKVCERRRKGGRGGGVALYVKNTLNNYANTTIKTDRNSESLWTDVVTGGEK